MSDNKKSATTTTENTASADKFTINYCLEQIEKIQSQTEHLNQVITELRNMETSGGAAGFADSQKATTLAEVVKCRETTNQKLLAFYEKMYDDLKPRPSLKEQALSVLGEAVDRHDVTEEMLESISNMIDTIRHIG